MTSQQHDATVKTADRSDSKPGPDVKGRFALGNKGGPGNPHAAQVAKFRAVVLDLMTEEDFIAIFRALMDRAKEGNLSAIRLALQYTLGKPQTFAESEPIGLESLLTPLLAPSANEGKRPTSPSPNGLFNSAPPGKPPASDKPILAAPTVPSLSIGPEIGRRAPVFDDPAGMSVTGKHK